MRQHSPATDALLERAAAALVAARGLVEEVEENLRSLQRARTLYPRCPASPARPGNETASSSTTQVQPAHHALDGA